MVLRSPPGDRRPHADRMGSQAKERNDPAMRCYAFVYPGEVTRLTGSVFDGSKPAVSFGQDRLQLTGAYMESFRWKAGNLSYINGVADLASAGDVFGSILDLDDGTVRFFLNGRECLIFNESFLEAQCRFTGHQGRYYPVATLSGSQVRIRIDSQDSLVHSSWNSISAQQPSSTNRC